jgi:hypothetical protein
MATPNVGVSAERRTAATWCPQHGQKTAPFQRHAMIGRMDDARTKQWLMLTAALDRTMREHAPGWTDHNTHDPGLTVLELMAYLAEDLQRNARAVDGGAAAVSRIVRALDAYAGKPIATSGTVRPNFFTGRLLTADDLREEQEYHREKHRRHLQMLHGFGVVDGLDVGVASDGTTISIEPGVAIDAYGREVVLDDLLVLPIPVDTPSPICVVVQYAERLVDPMPVPDGGTEPGHIEEGCGVSLMPGPGDDSVAVARLIREQAVWRVDTAFVPSRIQTRKE